MINLTPHAISVQHADGTLTVWAPSGAVARVSMTETLVGTTVDDIPLIRRVPGAVTMPELAAGVTALVSSMVLDALAATADPRAAVCYAPDSGPTAIRRDGQVVAVTRLVTA